jgi:hypothetical protein
MTVMQFLSYFFLLRFELIDDFNETWYEHNVTVGHSIFVLFHFIL